MNIGGDFILGGNMDGTAIERAEGRNDRGSMRDPAGRAHAPAADRNGDHTGRGDAGEAARAAARARKDEDET